MGDTLDVEARRSMAELQERLRGELTRVSGRAVQVWEVHEGHAWARWTGSGEVALYVVLPALQVLSSFGDDAAATDRGTMDLVIALENASAYVSNLDQFPWWKLLG